MLTLHVPDADPQDRLLAAEFRREIALLMYQRKAWSLGQAARYAGVPYVVFQRLLGQRKIPLNYSETSFMEDVETMKQFRS